VPGGVRLFVNLLAAGRPAGSGALRTPAGSAGLRPALGSVALRAPAGSGPRPERE